MKIIFICGSIEPGKDGVGDYARRIASQLIREGHAASIIALNDPFLNESRIKETQNAEGTSICVLRLSSCITWKERMTYAREYIIQENPEWLSLQFVPYAYNRKGLPFFLGKRLKKMGRGMKWHVMFHELWLGIELRSEWKKLLIGTIQKEIVLLIYKYLKPICHTHTQLFYEVLLKKGITCKILPLFGNIPISSQLPKIERGLSFNLLKDAVIIVHFGSIRPDAPVNKFLHHLKDFATRNNKKVSLIMIGKYGNAVSLWQEECLIHNIHFMSLKEQPVENISYLLSNADLGISSVPSSLVEKSGTVAAMLEHKLPVLIVARTAEFGINFKLPAGVFDFSTEAIETCLKYKFNDVYTMSKACEQFVKNLSEYK